MMGKLRPKNYSIFLFTVLVILAAAVLRQIGFMTEGPMKLFCAILRPLIYIGIFVIWSVPLRRRTIQPQVRRYLTAISTLMVFWLTVRTTKYLFTEDPWTLRHLWYLYYLPMLFIPLLGLLVALSLGKAEKFPAAEMDGVSLHTVSRPVSAGADQRLPSDGVRLSGGCSSVGK